MHKSNHTDKKKESNTDKKKEPQIELETQFIMRLPPVITISFRNFNFKY